MNTHEIQVKVTSAMYELIREKGVASPVEVLMKIGALSKENYEAWRLGRIPYLERVCTMNLHKLSAIIHEVRVYAKKHDLKGSWTMYKKWKSKDGKVIPLRFSKSGLEQIEREYATHYISAAKVAEAQERREFQKAKDELAGTVAPCGLVCGLCAEKDNCGGCRESKYDRADTCYQRKCAAERGLKGCWKCANFASCSQDMFSPEHDVRIRAFVRCAKEDGVKGLAAYLLKNQEAGIMYHRDKTTHTGDYDGLGTEEAVLERLRMGIISNETK